MAKEKNNIENTALSNKERKELIKTMKRLGYLLPTNDEELEEFEKLYGTTKVLVPEHLTSGSFLFETNIKSAASKEKKVAVRKSVGSNSKPAKNDYFKKIVLAAEIAFQLYEEPTFGHKKFVKVLYLCQEVCKMRLSTNFEKFAAGPLDAKLMHMIDGEFKKQGWFKLVAREKFGYKYELLDKVEKYKPYYQRYYSKELESIARVIDLFRKSKSDFCEIIATLFYVWKELMSTNTLVNDATLMQGFYEWHPDKKRFQSNQLENAIRWMEEQQIVPVVW